MKTYYVLKKKRIIRIYFVGMGKGGGKKTNMGGGGVPIFSEYIIIISFHFHFMASSFCAMGVPIILARISIEEYFDSLPIDTLSIHLIGEGLTYIPSMARFKDLRRLDLAHNKLTELPDDLDKCMNLTHLSCHNNRITHLPECIGNMFRLQHILCQENCIERLPRKLPPYIVTLYADNNRLTSFPVSHTNKYPHLQNLNLNHNRIAEMPAIQMHAMHTFSISFNPTRKIGNITNMEYGRIYWCNTTIYRLMTRINLSHVHSMVLRDIGKPSHVPVPSNETLHIFAEYVEESIWRFRFAFYLGKCRRRLLRGTLLARQEKDEIESFQATKLQRLL